MSDNSENIRDILPWQPYHEDIFVDWADKASCYKWLHLKAHSKYNWKRNLFTIPVIIMSTLTGTANFALERFPVEYKDIASIGIGSVNILAGIITTVAQFLKINELCESHRVAFIAWDKLYRSIRIELIKCPNERTDVKYLLKVSKDEFDRLMETSPQIDKDLLNKFMVELIKGKTKDDIIKKTDIFNKLHKPELFNEINSLKNIVYVAPKEPQMSNQEKLRLQNILKIKENEQDNEKLVDNFIRDFQKEYNRLPTREEIENNTLN